MTVDDQRPDESESGGETLRIDSEAPPAPESTPDGRDPAPAYSPDPGADEAPAVTPEGPGSFGFEEDRPAFPTEEDRPAVPVDEARPAYTVEEVPDDYAQRPELYAGGAFVGGFLLAKLIGRFGRG